MSVGANAHIPVLLNEAIDGLRLKVDGIYVDCTFGRGGHSSAILERLGTRGRLIALDKDPDAIASARSINDARLTTVHASFVELGAILKRLGIERVNGILLDLGVSSPQLDNPARGFSFRNDGPLDMRMDVSKGQTVAEWLANVGEAEIAAVIKEYGEERFAKRIARAIVVNRMQTPITTTQSLAQLVEKAVPTREPGQHPATRTFQALRIFINRELDEISQLIPQAVEALAPGGRLVVISFHSLEDRIVKRVMRAGSVDLFPAKLPIRASEMGKPKLHVVGKPIKPSAAEIARNPRARSAVMRIAERLAA